MGCSKSSSYREVHSNTGIQKTRKISNKQPNLPPKELEKEQTEPNAGRREEIKRVREKKKSIKPRAGFLKG